MCALYKSCMLKSINDEAGFLTGGCQVYFFSPFPHAWWNGGVSHVWALILRVQSDTTAQFLSRHVLQTALDVLPLSLAPAYKESVWSPQENSKVISKNS